MHTDCCNELEDEQLVTLAIEHHRYFACIVDRYSSKLLRYIMRISDVSKEEAEDILQETYINAYKYLRSFDSSLSFSSWIYRIAHNQVISQFRKRQVRPHGHTIDLEDNALEHIASELNVIDDVEKSLLKDKIGTVLDDLPLKYKEVLVLRFLEDKSYSEIADILKKPEGTIATLLNRAKKQCKKNLEL